MNNKRIYSITYSVASIAIAILAAFLLYQNLSSKVTIEIFEKLKAAVIYNSEQILFLLLLMMVNWILESFKWKLLIHSIKKVKLMQAFKSILVGNSMNLLAPNRLGDHIGRLWFLKKQDRYPAIYLNLVGTFSQMLVTLVAGSVGIYFLEFYSKVDYSPHLYLFTYLFPLLSLVAIPVYFKSSIFKVIFSWIYKRTESRVELHEVSIQLRFKVLLLSLLRYSVFTLQMVLIVNLFTIDIDLLSLLPCLLSLFFITTIIPTGWISEVIVRTSVAFYLFETISMQGEIGVASSVLLWLINLALPSFIGLFFIPKWDKLNLQYKS